MPSAGQVVEELEPRGGADAPVAVVVRGGHAVAVHSGGELALVSDHLLLMLLAAAPRRVEVLLDSAARTVAQTAL